MRAAHWLWILVCLIPFAARAETVYVIDRLQVGLRATPDGNVVKPLETGAVLEVLGRDARFVQVRDKAGAEGWLEARFVSPEPPVRLQVTKLQEELNKTRTQLSETEAQLKNSAATPPANLESADAGFQLDYLWVLVALGMLVVGFIAGILWHRESIRRRMGGMYLRI